MKVAMNEFCEKSIKHLNVITDSPTSHSKGIFWLIKVFCEEFGINVKWIYLERGHGKGIPDGLGVTVKRPMKICYFQNRQSQSILLLIC